MVRSVVRNIWIKTIKKIGRGFQMKQWLCRDWLPKDMDLRIVNDVENFISEANKNDITLDEFEVHGCKFRRSVYIFG